MAIAKPLCIGTHEVRITLGIGPGTVCVEFRSVVFYDDEFDLLARALGVPMEDVITAVENAQRDTSLFSA
jgi:hypothetical protein